MSNKTKMALLAALTIGAVAIPLTITTSFAQEQTKPPVDQPVSPATGPQGGFGGPPQGGPGQGGPPGQGGGQFRPGQGMPGGGMMMGGGGGGGGTAMVDDGNFLFIVQGNRVFKLNKSDLKVAAQGELPRPQMPGGPGGGGGGVASE